MALCSAKITSYLGPNVYTEAPDGSWGWVIAVAFFIVEVFTYGVIKSFGIFLKDIMEEFRESNSRVSWIISIAVFVMTFNGPLSSVMTNRFGSQFVVMIGGLLISTGTIATSFTTSVVQMYITYGLVTGLGYCFTFLPTVTILSKYFTFRRSLVIAVASTGESLSMFALAPAFSALRDKIGWRHTMTVIGALESLVIICGGLLRPIIIKPTAAPLTAPDNRPPKEMEALETQEVVASIALDNVMTKSTNLVDSVERTLLNKEAKMDMEPRDNQPDSEKGEDVENQEISSCNVKSPAPSPKLLDFTILKESSFILYSLFGLFATLGFFAPPLYIIDLSVSCGVGRDSAAYMLSIMAVAEILGRFFIGWVLTRKVFRTRKLLVLLVCIVVMTVDLVGFTLASEFYSLAVCCTLYGFFMGTLSCTHIPMLAEDDVVGIERMSSAAGVYVFIQSFAGLAGPPLGGVLVDVTQNYGSAFYSCAFGMGLSAVFLGLVKPAKGGLCCRRSLSQCSTAEHERNPGFKEASGEQNPEERTSAPNELEDHQENRRHEVTHYS